ncbi:hypothetical protein MMC18_005048 [Xylographa bjoerkii]|nr:hypothetical protein [Xylographa bjoerkii]
MALHTLSIETTLHILYLVTPNDIASLRLSSRKLYQVIQCHESFVCKAIAKAHYLRYKCPASSSPQIEQGMQPLQFLREQWRRNVLIERIVAEIAFQDSCTRRSLWNLWDYHEALVSDFQQQTPNNHRAFVQATSADDLVSLISTVRRCGSLLCKVSKPDLEEAQQWVSEATSKGLGSHEWYSHAFAEIVITKGVGFIVEIVLEKEPQAIKEFWNWTRPCGKSAFLRLCEEQRLKCKIAALQANALAFS